MGKTKGSSSRGAGGGAGRRAGDGAGAATAIVADYLTRLHDLHLRRRGTPELSMRAALENLLNAVGETLDPPVQATAELADTGAGRPDFGLFESRSDNARAVVETKAPEEPVPHTADGKQVARYWKQYGVVLVTNYRDFLLVAKEADGSARVEARCALAADEETFWRTAPGTLARHKAEELTDFLIGVMRRSAPVLRPRDLAADLARHAREARRRIDAHDTAALEPLQRAMEQALGLHFTGEEGQHFFRSSLVQTLFYGLFSGWMLWRQNPRHREHEFDWHQASEFLALPLIGDLYEEIARPSRLRDLNLREPLEWATASLNNVEEAEFFKNFDADHAITLFYEPFLQAFDPELRKELGVWYTPSEIVRYMVGRVDQLLRSELGIKDGLADDSVYVLDPAAGTGSYVVEVARRIHQTLIEQGHGSLAAARVKKALTTRVFGFEILPAPYVVAHLQLGVLLRSLGTTLSADQRAGIYLTNALTGWEPPKGAKQTLAFHFLQEEQEAATRVKRTAPILVILGNPPYNGFAGVAQEEEGDLIAPYKARLLEDWGVRKQLMDDLYVRFFRLAEKRIGEIGGKGIVCYISNSSWLDGLSHPVMREHILRNFDDIWIDNCNGDKYRTGKRTPDGKSDQSMFTTDSQPVGIQVGTAIATLVKKERGNTVHVRYRDLWGLGNAKRLQLVQSLSDEKLDARYHVVAPTEGQRWIIAPGAHQSAWAQWRKLPDIFGEGFKGVQPGRGGALVAIDRAQLVEQMTAYVDPDVSETAVRERYPTLMNDEAGYDANKVRRAVLEQDTRADAASFLSVLWLPFDVRTLYWKSGAGIVHRARPEFREQVHGGNHFLAITQRPRKDYSPPLVTTLLGSYYVFDPYTSYFPLWRHAEDLTGVSHDAAVTEDMLQSLCAANDIAMYPAKGKGLTPEANRLGYSLFFHVLAILWSPAYRKENEAALRQDWPRVPIPNDAAVLEASARLGREVADLLLPDKPVEGVTTGRLREELRTLAVPTKTGGAGGAIEEPADTKVTAGWGFRGQKNAVMCGKGKVVPHRGGDADADALDVYINDSVCWANVPADVWRMTIGGYPVVKKWLSYREYKVLGRALKGEELTYVTEVVRRLKALLILGEKLDANYRVAAAAAATTTPAAGAARDTSAPAAR